MASHPIHPPASAPGLHLKVAFDGVLEGALVSATEDALEGRSEGALKSVLQDPYKDVPESSFEFELKGAL